MDRFHLLLAPETPSSGEPARRAGSVTLRQNEDGPDSAALMDPANKSLADALNVLLGIIYIAVGALFLAYIAKGFNRVQEGEQGIRVVFGKMTHSGLAPGLHWAPPFPFGELIKVKTGVERVAIEEEFWVPIPAGTVNQSLDQLGPSQSLKPEDERTGSIITGDGNLVHARWSATYRRSNTREFAQNVLLTQEQELVRSAVKAGVVQACAEMNIDALLRQTADSSQTGVAARARQIAQDTLDAMQAGIVLESMQMTEVTPPLWVRKDFAAVQSATSQSQKALEEAQTARATILNETAGELSAYILERIDAYEAAIATDDKAKQTTVLAEIDSAMQGAPVKTSDRDLRVSGSVTKTIADAQAYRSEVVSQAQSKDRRFRAMMSQFESNPLVMTQREWAGAVKAFYSKPQVQMLWLPAAGTGDVLQLSLNRDPLIQREIEKKVREGEARKAREEQARQLQRSGFTTETPNEMTAE
ncbi:MAG: SPFH domain-containing protein [Phycisphaerae bacterium]|jgi:regulator of protease activity HflC (stomatin/prohibitin superfamily)